MSVGSLIKKSCNRLEIFEAESDITADDRIIKKLDKMLKNSSSPKSENSLEEFKSDETCEDVPIPEKKDTNKLSLVSDLRCNNKVKKASKKLFYFSIFC